MPSLSLKRGIRLWGWPPFNNGIIGKCGIEQDALLTWPTVDFIQ